MFRVQGFWFRRNVDGVLWFVVRGSGTEGLHRKAPPKVLVHPKHSMGVSENLGYPIWGPYNKDPTIWGTILGPPIFGNSHIVLQYNRLCRGPPPPCSTCSWPTPPGSSAFTRSAAWRKSWKRWRGPKLYGFFYGFKEKMERTARASVRVPLRDPSGFGFRV